MAWDENCCAQKSLVYLLQQVWVICLTLSGGMRGCLTQRVGVCSSCGPDWELQDVVLPCMAISPPAKYVADNRRAKPSQQNIIFVPNCVRVSSSALWAGYWLLLCLVFCLQTEILLPVHFVISNNLLMAPLNQNGCRMHRLHTFSVSNRRLASPVLAVSHMKKIKTIRAVLLVCPFFLLPPSSSHWFPILCKTPLEALFLLYLLQKFHLLTWTSAVRKQGCLFLLPGPETIQLTKLSSADPLIAFIHSKIPYYKWEF